MILKKEKFWISPFFIFIYLVRVFLFLTSIKPTPKAITSAIGITNQTPGIFKVGVNINNNIIINISPLNKLKIKALVVFLTLQINSNY